MRDSSEDVPRLLERLDPHRFRRVHRSHVVNLDAVEHFRANEDRRLRIFLRNGSEVVASRAASEELRKLCGNPAQARSPRIPRRLPRGWKHPSSQR